MLIDIEQFDEIGDGPPVRPETNKSAVLALLAANPERAFRPSEVAEATGVNPNSVGTVLSRLEADRLVHHQGSYWAVVETAPVPEFVVRHRHVDAETADLATEAVDLLVTRIRGE